MVTRDYTTMQWITHPSAFTTANTATLSISRETTRWFSMKWRKSKSACLRSNWNWTQLAATKIVWVFPKRLHAIEFEHPLPWEHQQRAISTIKSTNTFHHRHEACSTNLKVIKKSTQRHLRASPTIRYFTMKFFMRFPIKRLRRAKPMSTTPWWRKLKDFLRHNRTPSITTQLMALRVDRSNIHSRSTAKSAIISYAIHAYSTVCTRSASSVWWRLTRRIIWKIINSGVKSATRRVSTEV